MNYMKQVAQMLGVEIDEEFKIKGRKETFKFNDCHLLYRLEGSNTWDKCDVIFMLLLSGQDEIQKPILTEKEKEYLSYVIKPFRDSITYFYKRRYENDELEWIKIEMKIDDVMYFPKFKKGTMYKGMELNKKYTLEELNI